MKPKISVIIAAYDCSLYIAQAVESVLVQDYATFEIVILNDGSTDGTGKILNTYRKHPLIRIFSQKHRGQGWAKDKLVKAARGKYIALFDADDVMLPGRLRKQAEILDKYSSFGGCYGKAKIVDTYLRPRKDKLYGVEFGTSFKDSWDLIRTPMLPGTLMFRKRIAEKIGGFNKKLNYSADTDFMLRLAENARLFFINECIILYRRRKGAVSYDNREWQEKSRQEELTVRRVAIKRRYGVDLKSLNK